MSKKQNGVLITAPLFGTGKEAPEEFRGYSCGACQGNGWYWDWETYRDATKKTCAACGGTGQVKAVVTVEWFPDGEIKSCLK